MENKLRNIFFQLLRIGLWGEGSLQLSHPLNEDEWSEIYNLALNHTVEGLIFDSFSSLKDEQLPPQSLRLKWAIRIDQIERYNAKMNSIIAKQSLSFAEHKIEPILQKGQGIASCYKIPEHRISGDIDWYLEKNDYVNARLLLKEQKIAFLDSAGFSLTYNYNGINIEHHKKLFDIQSPFKKKFLDKIYHEYKLEQKKIMINGTLINTLAPELQLLQVNAHILKHLLSFGIGLRQLCDSARLYYTFRDQIDQKLLLKLYKESGILKWMHLLHDILVNDLNLPEQFLPFRTPKGIKSNWMLDEIWHSGNFGFHDKRYEGGKVVSLISVQPNGALRLCRNLIRYLKYAPQEALFFPFVHIYSKFIGKDRG